WNELQLILQEYNSGNIKQQAILQNNEYSALFVIEQYEKYIKELVELNKRSKETYKTYSNFIIRMKKYLIENCPNLKIHDLNEIILNKIIK
ncbi:hypothetical protein, partial [Paraburkholderia sp. SIMBA_027]|uniref:hypothetical protein n=1 Tax=Paraburkholderia sp. SIMBA_027 TaxID=3085770 RepID=UPI00397CE9A6